jgi:OOP family OmpA-OmpF porin
LNSAKLTEQDKKSIDVFLSDEKDGNGPKILVVGGHTDRTGPDRYNYQLGRKRAESVAEYLILDKKIDPARVTAVSFGESSPLADNRTREAEQRTAVPRFVFIRK